MHAAERSDHAEDAPAAEAETTAEAGPCGSDKTLRGSRDDRHRSAGERNLGEEIRAAAELGWYDFLMTYRRSFLGPLWLPIQMMALVAIITLVLGRSFADDVGLYAVYLALGLFAWELMSSALMEGPRLFAEKASLIRSVPVSLSTLALRKLVYLLCRTGLVAPVVAGIALIFGEPPRATALLVLIALPLLALNAYCVLILFGLIGVYLRDFHFLMQTVLRFLFFMTPIFWSGDTGARGFISKYNPLTYFIEIVRAPAMGEMPPARAWVIVIATAAVGVIAAYFVQTRFKRAIVFWL